jgi:hypothetical protein
MTPSHVIARARDCTGAAKMLGERSVGSQSGDEAASDWFGIADEPVDAIADELEAARPESVAVMTGPGSEKRFERHVPVIFVERRVEDRERGGSRAPRQVCPTARRRNVMPIGGVGCALRARAPTR